MLRRLATPVRLVLMAMMFIVAGSGHHMAVAATMDGHAGHALQVHHDHGGGASQECGQGSCEPAAPSCCVMGQCMLATLPLAAISMRMPTKPVLSTAALFMVANAIPALPFRPPDQPSKADFSLHPDISLFEPRKGRSQQLIRRFL